MFKPLFTFFIRHRIYACPNSSGLYFTAQADFEAVSLSLTLTNISTLQCFNVSSLEDDIFELNENFTLVLMANVDVDDQNATVIIKDDESVFLSLFACLFLLVVGVSALLICVPCMYVSVHLSLLVAQFGLSFPFGAGVGDTAEQPEFDNSIFIPIPSFTFYGIARTNLYVSHTRLYSTCNYIDLLRAG